MSQATILVIDDSNTIRRLVDSHLSQSGYQVVLAPNAEDGLRLAGECQPNMILLDHQLPGTTGFEVCQQLLKSDELRKIPVVVSSTLRKKAYAEYTELPNVVDLLPKPFTPELLRTTVSNALDTGSLIVESQSQGTAVPETLNELDDTTLSGSFSRFGLREVLDFLNNGGKSGVLEVESQRERIRFYLEHGRIQAVTAAGVDPQEIAATLPSSLKELAAVLNFTAGGRFCTEVDGLVDLLDNKVLDPRLLRLLLRHQAAVLTFRSFHQALKAFRFEADTVVPPLFRRLPLEISLLALLVDGALCGEGTQSGSGDRDSLYVRKALRGQNLDRAGLSAQHMKLLGLMSEPISAEALALRLNWETDEVRRVLAGFALAELVEVQQASSARTVVALEPDSGFAATLQEFFARHSKSFHGRVVRDRLALQLLFRRSQPDAVLIAVDSPELSSFAAELRSSDVAGLSDAKWIGIVDSEEQESEAADGPLDACLVRSSSEEQWAAALNGLFADGAGKSSRSDEDAHESTSRMSAVGAAS